MNLCGLSSQENGISPLISAVRGNLTQSALVVEAASVQKMSEPGIVLAQNSRSIGDHLTCANGVATVHRRFGWEEGRVVLIAFRKIPDDPPPRPRENGVSRHHGGVDHLKQQGRT